MNGQVPYRWWIHVVLMASCWCACQLDAEGPEDEEMTGLEVTSTFTANVWEVCNLMLLHPFPSAVRRKLLPAAARCHCGERPLVSTGRVHARRGHRQRGPEPACAEAGARMYAQVRCKVGDHVAKGQTLVVLEAMKMEYPIAAPSSGQVGLPARCPEAALLHACSRGLAR